MAKAENQADIAQIELDLEGVEPQDVQTEVGHEAEPVEGVEQTAAAPDEIAELRKQLEESNRRATEAEGRANSLHAEKSASENRLATEVNGRFAAQEQAIESRFTAAKSSLETSKRELARAYSEQRFEDVAELQGVISAATLDVRQAEFEKSQLAGHKERLAADIEANNARSRDPVESFIAQIPGDKSRQWLRNHPDILKRAASSTTDAKRLYGYAQVAEADGHAPDSEGYFDSIEKQFGLKEQDTAVTQARETKPAPKAPGQTANAAPSTRSANTAQASRTVTLDDVVRKLTPSDRNNAKISFPDKTSEEAEKLYAQGIVISKKREPGFRPDIRL